MDDKNKQGKTNDPFEPESHSAFPRRDKAADSPAPTGDKPIPSQPRSFSPVRPQRNAVPRKGLSTPAASDSPETGGPAAAEAPAAAVTPSTPSVAGASPNAGATSSFPRPTTATAKSTSTVLPTKTASAPDSKPAAAPAAEATGTVTGAAAGTAASAPPPQSSGAGGDTIRLRVQPRSHARTLNTAPGRGLRRRLPDIRQGKATTNAASYGPFAMLFGFLWLMFKMIFFTGLVLGLGALIGFMIMTEYIKTPEVTVPNVSGMKIEEAFEVLSDKELGVIKLRTESSGLVAPGEIISQQPPAGASAKVKTDVGVVISSGRSQYVVPNVVNETRENAMNKIRGARLEVGNVLSLEDASVPRGNVISQNPLGGQGYDEPVKVDLMISAGPPGKSLSMPDLSGRTVLEAKAALQAVGIEDVETVPADAPADAEVKSHTPLVGKTVFQTDKITLTTED